MEMDRALEVVGKLADGIDPVTGEEYGEDSPYQQADTVRALHVLVEAVKGKAAEKTEKKDGPAKAGKAWSQEEEEKMVKMFDSKSDVTQIAKVLCRTTGAIWARLEKVGKVTRNADGRIVRVTAPLPEAADDEPAIAECCEF